MKILFVPSPKSSVELLMLVYSLPWAKPGLSSCLKFQFSDREKVSKMKILKFEAAVGMIPLENVFFLSFCPTGLN